MFLTKYFLGVLVVCAVSGHNLPNYLTPCKRSDPNFDKCSLEKTQSGLAQVTKGDKTFKSPPLDPFKVALIEVDAGPNLNLKFKNLVVKGLSDFQFDSVKFDLTNNKAVFKAKLKKFSIEGDYEVNGRILVLPITGSGNAEVKFLDGDYTYEVKWDLVKKSDGQEYLKLKDPKMRMKLKQATFRLDNLFDGDKTLGENMNKVLNENWEAVLDEIGEGISHTISTVVTDILRNYLEDIPYNMIFPE